MKPLDKNKTIQLRIFYKITPLQTLLHKKENPANDIKKACRLVYQFNCPEEGCNASYIGYTSCSLQNRVKNHSYSGAIKMHFEDEHLISGKKIKCDYFKIIFKSNDVYTLQVAEALLIKKLNPDLNRRQEGLTRKLYIF